MPLVVSGCAGSAPSTGDLSPFESEAYPVLLDQLKGLASNGPVLDHNFICIVVVDQDGKIRPVEGTALITALRRATPVDMQIELVDAAGCEKDSGDYSVAWESEPARDLFARKLVADERGNWVSGWRSKVFGQWSYYKVEILNGEITATPTGTFNWD